MRQKVRRGEWLTKAPFGYVNNPRTRNIEPHPVHSKIIVKAFEEYAKGEHGLVSLADFLALHGVTTGKGTPLGKASIKRMLTNRAYLGFVCHHDEWFDGSFAPIISPKLFEAVQKYCRQENVLANGRPSMTFRLWAFLRAESVGACLLHSGLLANAEESIDIIVVLKRKEHAPKDTCARTFSPTN